MEEKHNHIDTYIRQSLDGFEPEPSERVWKGIKRKLAWNEFVHFNITNFTSNIYQISATVLIGAGIIVGLVTQLLLVDKIRQQAQVPLAEKDIPTIIQPESPKPEEKLFDSSSPIRSELSEKPLPSSISFLPSSPSFAPEPTIESLETPGLETSIAKKTAFAIPLLPSHGIDRISLALPPSQLYQPLQKPGDSIAFGFEEPEKYPYRFGLEAGWWYNQMTLPYPGKDFSYYWNAVGVAFEVEHRNFYAKTGLNFSRMFDRLPFDISYKSLDSIRYVYNVHYYVPDPSHPDNIILITSRETLYDSITHNQNIFTTGTYNYLNIPFQLGCKFLKTGSFAFDAYAGCGLQFLISKKEPLPVIFNYMKTGLNLNPSLVDHYNFNYFFFGGLNIRYFINENLKLELQPVYQYYMKSLGDHEGAGNPYLWGLKIGIGYYF